MNYPLISEYIEAIKAAKENFDELKNLRPVLDEDGGPVMTSGNFAVVFKMKDEQTGKQHAVKCFLKDQEGRAEAYRMIAEELEYVSSTFLTPIKYLDKELFVDSMNSDETEFPVLLMDWVEGQTLDKYIQKYVYRYQRAEYLDETTESEEKAVELLVNGYELEKIAYQFSCLAIWLLQQPFAHGDLKPDNIIVKEDGRLVLVDYDGMYVPAMKGQKARELGSPDFRHPLRNENDFDEHIDDFPLSSILLSLLAIANEPSLLEKYGGDGRLLLSERDYRNIAESEVLDALRPLMADKNLTTYLSLFYLCSAQKSLFKESYHLFTLPEPEKPSIMLEEENLSTEVTDGDLADAWTDTYGVKYSADKKRLLKAPNEINDYSVLAGTIVICNDAFRNCKQLISIIISDSVKTIGKRAFFNCSNISLVKIPDSIRQIKSRAFFCCYRLTSVLIPQNVVEIGEESFTGCINLTSIEVHRNNKIYDSRNDSNAIIETHRNTIVLGCSSTRIPEDIIRIGKRAFYGCEKIHTIVIPDNVMEIEFAAFAGCVNLESITMPKMIEEIAQAAFLGCKKLKIINLPESLTVMGNRVFYECTNLKKISLPKSLDKIGEEVFSGCSSLNQILIPIGSKEKFLLLLPDFSGKLIEQECGWAVKDTRLFDPEEIALVKRAEVVASQYGNSVCFFMQTGGQTYIPLCESSSLSVGDSFDLKTAKIITLYREGKDDIVRVIE